jgi:hypothetical protein
MERQQPPFGDDDVGQTEQTEQTKQLRLVLGQSLVAGLLVGEQVLDHMKRMRDPNSDLSLGTLQRGGQ